MVVDNDGDTLLVVADKTIIEVAERNMQDIVPLYYEMKKAEPVILNNEEFYKGMTAAWLGGNIGAISNDITKIWNSKDDIGENELLAVKLLCLENNLTIDFAKTLYKSTRPPKINDFIRGYTKSKMPHFFIYAKDYTDKQVVPPNNSLVNKLEKYIQNKRLSFKNFARFDYHKLMDNPSIHIDQRVIDTYIDFIKEFHFNVNSPFDSKDNIPYLISGLQRRLFSLGYSHYEVADMLVAYLYGQTNSRYKNILWLTYGDILLENIKRNVGTSQAVCMRCGRRFNRTSPNHKYCDHCFLERIKTDEQKIRVCKDCGKEFLVDKSVRNKSRCDNCQKEAERQREREKKRKQRENENVPTF